MKKTSYLDQLDDFLSFKTPNEITLIFFGTFLSIVLLSYLLLFTPSEEYGDEAQSRYSTATSKLNEAQSYIDVNHPRIEQNKNILKQKQDALDIARNTNVYFDNKLKELSYLLFNEQNWANFLDSLTQKAKQYDIKIDKIQNEFKIPSAQRPQQVLNIKISLKGTFKDILRYVNSIEESKLVVDINFMDIKKSKSILEGEIDIAVWGVKY